MCNLERVEKMKELGVTLDEKLNFYDHIHERVNKAVLFVTVRAGTAYRKI